MAAPQIRLSLLGGFQLTTLGRTVPLQPQAQRLIAFLAVRARPIQRNRLAEMLWPDSHGDRPTANLRTILWRIRSQDCPAVIGIGQQLALDNAVVVDIHELADLAHRVFDGSELADGAVSRLAQPGDLLPGWDDDWIAVERERMHQLRLHALELLCERLVAKGRFGWAVEACLAAVSEEPFRESAHRALIRAYLAEGNARDAVADYRAYRQLVLDELGIEPSAQMDDLIGNLLGGRDAVETLARRP